MKNMSVFQCPEYDRKVVGEWVQARERDRYELIACPQGFSKRSIPDVNEEQMQCKECHPELNFILLPNEHACQTCPPGLTCHGNAQVESKVGGATWTIQDTIFRLIDCPTGYYVSPLLEFVGEEFDVERHAHRQECIPCSEGTECVLEASCSKCTDCAPGTYKDSPGTAPCRKCAAGKYNTKTKSMSDSYCIACPDGADTRGLEGAVSIHNCTCVDNMYMTSGRTGRLGMLCFKCPAAAMCPDGRCGLASPDLACSGIGSDRMSQVKGTWIRTQEEKFRLIDCPVGHQLINETGYELQACSHCAEGKYISVSSDPSYKCYNCPPNARCPMRGRPVFPAAELQGEVLLKGPLPAQEVLIQLLAQTLGQEEDLVTLIDYDTLVESASAARRKKRRQNEAVTVIFRSFAFTEAEADDMLAGDACSTGFSDASERLASLLGSNSTQFSAACLGVKTKLVGEDWEEFEGVFRIKACPLGYLLVNATIDSQACIECAGGSYTLGAVVGCADEMCPARTCKKCPLGVNCEQGSSLAWKHFVPSALKIGQNYTRWATILGMGVDHKLSLRAKYEIAYDKTTGEAAPGDSEGANPDDYVWEYVETCTAAMQPCRREQVPSLITASPIPTLNHQSPPQTVQAHHHQ